LRLAERLADYYVQRLDGRQVPPWDFDATGDDSAIKDTAAAAVVASALIELGRIHPQAQAGATWSQRGLAMLEARATSSRRRSTAPPAGSRRNAERVQMRSLPCCDAWLEESAPEEPWPDCKLPGSRCPPCWSWRPDWSCWAPPSWAPSRPCRTD